MEQTISFLDDKYYRDFGLLILRIGIGAIFIYFHGWPKLTGGPETWSAIGKSMEYFGIHSYPEIWGLSFGLVEFLGGILVFFGLFFRPATILLVLNMILLSSVSLIDRGNGASVYLVEMTIVMLSLIFIGPGKFSLDSWRITRRYLT